MTDGRQRERERERVRTSLCSTLSAEGLARQTIANRLRCHSSLCSTLSAEGQCDKQAPESTYDSLWAQEGFFSLIGFMINILNGSVLNIASNVKCQSVCHFYIVCIRTENPLMQVSMLILLSTYKQCTIRLEMRHGFICYVHEKQTLILPFHAHGQS